MLPLSAGNEGRSYKDLLTELVDALRRDFNYPAAMYDEPRTINQGWLPEGDSITDLAECMIREYFFIGNGDSLCITSAIMERDDSELAVYLLIMRADWVPEGFIPVSVTVAVKGIQEEEFYEITEKVAEIIRDYVGGETVYHSVSERVEWKEEETIMDAVGKKVIDLIAEVMLFRLLMVSLSNIVVQRVTRGDVLSDKYSSLFWALWSFFNMLPTLSIPHRRLDEWEVFVVNFLKDIKASIKGEVKSVRPVVNHTLSSLHLRLSRDLQRLSEVQTKIDRWLMWLTIAVVVLSIPTFLLSLWELIIRLSSILGWH